MLQREYRATALHQRQDEFKKDSCRGCDTSWFLGPDEPWFKDDLESIHLSWVDHLCWFGKNASRDADCMEEAFAHWLVGLGV